VGQDKDVIGGEAWHGKANYSTLAECQTGRKEWGLSG